MSYWTGARHTYGIFIIITANGMLISAVNKNSNGAVTDTVTYLNDETGEILKTTDSENGTVTLTYLGETQAWNSAETTLLYSNSSTDEKINEYVNGTKFTTTYSSTDNTEQKTDLTTTETTAFGNLTKTVYSDAFGRVLKEETKNGSTVVMLKEYTYNTNGNYVTDQIKSVTTTVGNGTPETTRYTYDNNGNITGIYSKVGDGEETIVATYEYDNLGQLTKDNDTTITYDNYGNILTKGYSTYSYDDYNWSDKLTSTNGNNVAYDESGNIVEIFGDTLVWENGRELSQYSNGNYTINFEYNADGLRTQKEVSVDGFTTVYKYTWCGDKLTHQTWDDKYFHFYYDNNDEIIGVEYYDGETMEYYTYIKNIQGDVIGIVDSEGNLAGEYSYDAWGSYSYSGTDIAYYNPIRYKGYYCDIEISMYYLQSRYYSYILGRFINADDVEILDIVSYQCLIGCQMFAYCCNNVVNNIDISGCWKIDGNHTVKATQSGETLNSLSKKLLGKYYSQNNWTKIKKKYKTTSYKKNKIINMFFIQNILHECLQNEILKNRNKYKNYPVTMTYSYTHVTLNLNIAVHFVEDNNVKDELYNSEAEFKSTYGTKNSFKKILEKALARWKKPFVDKINNKGQYYEKTVSDYYKNVLGVNTFVKINIKNYKQIIDKKFKNYASSCVPGYLNIFLSKKCAQSAVYHSFEVYDDDIYMVLRNDAGIFNITDFEYTLRHEMGHVFGLHDAYNGNFVKNFKKADKTVMHDGDKTVTSLEILMMCFAFANNKKQYYRDTIDNGRRQSESEAVKFYRFLDDWHPNYY